MTEDWWKSAVIYQVYPRSFQDSNGDGIGDLRGITARLDDLKALGIDAIWISPIFPSPMADFGYDVADYCGIDPRFGTLDDFDSLLAAAHARGIRLLLDLVPNHSSSEHPWFKESRASRDNPKRDWYIWIDCNASRIALSASAARATEPTRPRVAAANKRIKRMKTPGDCDQKRDADYHRRYAQADDFTTRPCR